MSYSEGHQQSFPISNFCSEEHLSQGHYLLKGGKEKGSWDKRQPYMRSKPKTALD